ncbi:signal recognition particle-docking protein FtsY [Pseudomonas sp. 5Ae-yellow]|uniref:signal recognition particle-docking protein FtsY n=1 Tax=Pseudomonas sp. 5Ae-yellow TaxID=2759848 RepID=UPI0015F66FE1|nr:signal recognition particle-docking protein FtsY [Pseudomonas sp. 5Ae-yellow]MBA6419047.1 signal recognition particle-docking protein FtsY [Pseudomonas sp. 5Ae-yellow]|tara:strand:- start:1812 stop:3017 length:1206 start_codon:yes stop_codon:yes gene_type:complete
MFGSKDKPESPENKAADSAAKPEKKGLFGWARRKEAPAPAPEPEQDAPAPLSQQLDSVEAREQAAREAAASLFSELGQSAAEPVAEPQPVAEEESKGFFSRMKKGLSKTSANLGEGMANMFLGEKEIDDELLEEMETRLLMADVGIEATTLIMESLQERVTRRQVSSRKALYRALQGELEALLVHVAKPMEVDSSKKPYVILVVGVNGVGKTTTIGKLAKRLQSEGKQVMLAAGDTFRAAAVEQLQVWGERNQISVVAQHTGADSASVIFDALQAAKSRGADVLIADTAGRLHNKDHLMDELAKVKRVMAKLDVEAPHEVLLVLDAGTGQNAISQTKLFDQAVGLTGLALTKLDGTAKGGVIFALAKQFGLPIRYIGVGEQIDDLRPFTAPEFVEALFGSK